jgi:hypothetical protein
MAGYAGVKVDGVKVDGVKVDGVKVDDSVRAVEVVVPQE